MTKPSVILTRAQSSADKFAVDLRKNGDMFDIHIHPLFETKFYTPHISLTDTAALIFTSANGVRAFASHQDNRDFTAYCVGPQTGELARDAGFKTFSGNGNINSLLPLLPTGDAFTYIRGKTVSYDLVSLLPDLNITDAIYYAHTILPTPARLLQLLQTKPCILPIFSKASANHVKTQFAEIDLSAHIAVAISPKVADCLEGRFGHITTCAHPNRASMIASLHKIAKNPSLVAG